MKALLCGFDLSVLGFRNQTHTTVYTVPVGTKFYLDPVYFESGILNTEIDVYSYGVVLFELLCGMMVSDERSIGDDKPGPLIYLIRRYYDEGLEELIDPHIRDEIDVRSFNTFKEIACKCLSFNLQGRPTMDMIIQKIEEALEFQASH
ncbi:hypothetical protein L1987_83883 [Smallanthus sonchifolius]|uniref:Uncharacterized protein n=1 Tax=Smallanthus sonchifolius TaxID=185202 RepID=A0ACB8YED1_9ASTR|nr:hypothetical protein L1987_83883 [Smallanthus sonchifolius]